MGEAAPKHNLVYHPTHRDPPAARDSFSRAAQYAERVRAKLELGQKLDCLKAINKLVALQTGKHWGIDALDEFFSVIKAEPVRRESLLELILEVTKPQKIFGSRDPRPLVSEFLRWYLQRVRSLASFDHSQGHGLGSPDIDIADCKISHDIICAGVRGMRASCRLTVRARAGTTLWLAFSLEQDGQAVSCAPGWESWGMHVGPRLQLESQILAEAMGLLPLLIAEQEKIIDLAEIFLPYSALSIAVAAKSTTAKIQLLSASGNILEEQRIEIQLGGLYRELAVISPQAREVWPQDFLRGSEIRRDPTQQVVICDQRYQKVSLKVRALDAYGEGQLVFNQEISPDFSVQPMALPKVEVPENAQFIEYLLESAKGEILCGSLEAVRTKTCN